MNSRQICLQARGLTKRYNGFLAVAGIDFAVYRGECFGFLGPNGAGKTSTMRMIYRAATITGGSLNIVGLEAMGGHNDRAIKAHLGVVPQDDNLDEELSVRENIEIFCRFAKLYGRESRDKIAQLLDFVQLRDKSETKVGKLSGGQKRRCLIARGLVGTPQILVLDEPTTGLDPASRINLWGQLRDLQALKKTLLLTTHYMDEAAYLCDRLAIMDLGRIVDIGTPDELIKKHIQSEVIEVYFPLGEVPRSLPPHVGALVERFERQSDRLVIYCQDETSSLGPLHKHFENRQILLRKPTLEDVFLKLTGKRLDD